MVRVFKRMLLKTLYGGKAELGYVKYLRGMLENSQFEQIAKFEAMVRENVIRVEEPRFMPMRA